LTIYVNFIILFTSISGAGINSLTYIMEFTKIKLRPRVVNFVSHAVALGSLYMPGK